MEAISLSPALDVREVTDRAGFQALEGPWNALVGTTGDEPFLRHEFLRIWIDNFAPGAKLRILTAWDGGRLVAALPLMEQWSALYGVPVRELTSTANPHSCRFDLIAEDAGQAGRAFFRHLAADRSWDVLRIIDVPDGGNAWSIHQAADDAGWPVGTWESLRSPYVPLPASVDGLQATLQTKFKANLRRRWRKLEERGPLVVERISTAERLEERLEEGYALESGGWKGERGTAIDQDRATRGFYSELARSAAYRNQLSLYFLTCGGRPVAFHYALTHGGRYFLLKPGYDESVRECSPGQLLVDQVLRDSIGRGLREFDFLGPDMVWKRDWTEQVRVHTWLYVFRDSSFGRALRSAKFRWVPAAKEVVARWKR